MAIALAVWDILGDPKIKNVALDPDRACFVQGEILRPDSLIDLST